MWKTLSNSLRSVDGKSWQSRLLQLQPFVQQNHRLPAAAARTSKACAAAASGPQQQSSTMAAGQAAPKHLKMVLVVAVALVDDKQRVLLAQRPPGKAMAGLWEFPGGKVDAGEVPEAALARELQEELNITVQARDLEPLTFASHAYDNFHLLMPLYVCRTWVGEPHGVEGQQLAWVSQQQIHDYAMPAADVPLVRPVLQAMSGVDV